MTAKQLEQETGCKIMVRGKGSMRDRKKVGIHNLNVLISKSLFMQLCNNMSRRSSSSRSNLSSVKHWPSFNSHSAYFFSFFSSPSLSCLFTLASSHCKKTRFGLETVSLQLTLLSHSHMYSCDLLRNAFTCFCCCCCCCCWCIPSLLLLSHLQEQ